MLKVLFVTFLDERLFRCFYSQIPIPGSEISLDGAALRAESTTEKEALMTQLRETLEELSRTKQFENRNTETNAHQEMLRKVPLAIYIG